MIPGADSPGRPDARAFAPSAGSPSTPAPGPASAATVDGHASTACAHPECIKARTFGELIFQLPIGLAPHEPPLAASGHGPEAAVKKETPKERGLPICPKPSLAIADRRFRREVSLAS